MSTRLYVGNIPFKTTAQELRELFETIGPVINADVVLDRDTGRPRGFAFVELEDAHAQRAIAELGGTVFGGRALTINQAKERPRREYTPAGHDRARRGGYDTKRGERRRERDW